MKNKVIQSLRGQLLCYGSWGERLISQQIWWWVPQVERLAITREQGQSKRVRHSLGSEIRRGWRARESVSSGRIVTNRHSEARERTSTRTQERDEDK